MPLTRAQAQVLLNVGEMQLYDDSRINGLRKLDAKGLQKRVERARRSRDRARDLVQRQKLATRDRTGSKRGQTGLANQRSKQKAEVLGDILKRFEDALKADSKAAKVAAGKPASKKTTTAASKKSSSRGAGRAALRRIAESAAPVAGARSSVTKRAVAGKKAAGSTATKKVTKKAAKVAAAEAPETKVVKKAVKKTARPKTAIKKTSIKKTAGKKADTAKASPARQQQKALRATQNLLKEKTARARAEQPWQALDSTTPTVIPAAGYQSSSAARKSLKLHEAETRMAPIHGSISTRDRRNQGKRDRRGGGED